MVKLVDDNNIATLELLRIVDNSMGGPDSCEESSSGEVLFASCIEPLFSTRWAGQVLLVKIPLIHGTTWFSLA